MLMRNARRGEASERADPTGSLQFLQSGHLTAGSGPCTRRSHGKPSRKTKGIKIKRTIRLSRWIPAGRCAPIISSTPGRFVRTRKAERRQTIPVRILRCRVTSREQEEYNLESRAAPGSSPSPRRVFDFAHCTRRNAGRSRRGDPAEPAAPPDYIGDAFGSARKIVLIFALLVQHPVIFGKSIIASSTAQEFASY